MAGGNVSPRQKMINMMYLVLTALLALNVSKEVLNSFFEVNLGIERSTTNFNLKNGDTYTAFDAAAELNSVKAGPYRDQAYSVKAKADELVEFIQEMKYNLVLATDKKVYLGTQTELKDEEGTLLEDKAITTPWIELTANQKKMTIGNLTVKDDRHTSGALFYDEKRVINDNNIATHLKANFLLYKDFILSIAEGNDGLVSSINETCNLEDKKGKGGKTQKWEIYNFYDMPAVGALTLLSKMQSDVRNTEADIINMLRENIDAGSLKFTSAEGIQIPQSNFVLRGDSFRAQIFISAKDTTQAPMIYVGEYDSLGNGNYQMKGTEGIDYNAVRVVNGKGMFAERTSSEGTKKWGGLIAMKTDNGTKMYPFKGEYLVAAKTAIVSPTKMLILYSGLEAIGGNPIQVSVPGYSASEITPRMSNGTLKATKKSEGMYSVFPDLKSTSAVVTLYVNVNGKQTPMGKVNFRVRKTPPPAPVIRSVDANGLCDRSILKTEIVQATLDNFLFDGLKYMVTSFKLSGSYKGAPASAEQNNGMGFTSQMQKIITNSASGSTISITKIRAQLIGSKRPSEAVKGDLVIEIK
jgi:gliding motility-associated protein GldM